MTDVMSTQRFRARLRIISPFICCALAGAGLAVSGCAEERHAQRIVTADAAPAAAPAMAEGTRLTSASGRYLAGRHARRTRDFRRAAEFFSDVLKNDAANVRIRREAFFALVASGNMKAAARAAREVVKGNKGAATANLALVVQDFHDGHFAAAAERLSTMPRRGMNTFAAPLLLAWAESARGDVGKAVSALDGLKNVASFSALRSLHLGHIYDRAGRAAEAETAFAETVEKTQSLRAVQAYGRFLERHGRPKEAAELYRKFIEKNPETDSVAAAAERVEAGTKPPPLVADAKQGAAEVLFNLAGTLAQSRSADLALIYGRLALYLRPDFPVAQLLVAGLLESLDRGAEAVEMYGSIARKSPLYWAARLRQTSTLDDLGRTDEAVRVLRAMAAERRDDPDPLSRLGDLFRSKERYAEAIEAYSGAVSRSTPFDRRHWTLFYARGIAYERSKHWPQAEADFLQALELNPEQPYVLNYLGYSWVDQGMNLDQARKMIRRAVELRPNDGFIVDSLGWVLYRAGDFKGAAEQLERAVLLRPEDPTINDHLGDAYWQVGRTLEARFQWQRALSLDPEKAAIPTIERKLRQGLAKKSDKDDRG